MIKNFFSRLFGVNQADRQARQRRLTEHKERLEVLTKTLGVLKNTKKMAGADLWELKHASTSPIISEIRVRLDAEEQLPLGVQFSYRALLAQYEEFLKEIDQGLGVCQATC